MSAPVWIAVALLGGAASLVRFLLDASLAERVAGPFPAGTLAVNLSGAVLLGLLAGVALHGAALTIVAGGGLGSYTTFSTWMFESHRLGEAGRAHLLWLNIGLSLARRAGGAHPRPLAGRGPVSAERPSERASEALKLAFYFGEHDRHRGRFLSEAVLDLFERRELASGVLLRGAEGFGAGQRLQTRSPALALRGPAARRRRRRQPRADRGCRPRAGRDGRRRPPHPRARPLRRRGHRPEHEPHEEVKLTVYTGRRGRLGAHPGPRRRGRRAPSPGRRRRHRPARRRRRHARAAPPRPFLLGQHGGAGDDDRGRRARPDRRRSRRARRLHRQATCHPGGGPRLQAGRPRAGSTAAASGRRRGRSRHLDQADGLLLGALRAPRPRSAPGADSSPAGRGSDGSDGAARGLGLPRRPRAARRPPARAAPPRPDRHRRRRHALPQPRAGSRSPPS